MKKESYYQQILSFANQNQACHLATTEGDQPRVRGMYMWFADETGFYFHTASTKKLVLQLKQNPKVEAAFIHLTDDPSQMRAMRVNGLVEFLEDKALEQRLLQERPWLREFEKGDNGSSVVIFRITNGEAFLWDMSKNLQEREIKKQPV